MTQQTYVVEILVGTAFYVPVKASHEAEAYFFAQEAFDSEQDPKAVYRHVPITIYEPRVRRKEITE